MEVGLAFGILPTDDRLIEIPEYVLDYMYAYIQRREDDQLARLEEMLGVRWTPEQARQVLSRKRSGGKKNNSLIRIPLAVGISSKNVLDIVKANYDMSSGYSEDAHTDSLIGGRVVRKPRGVEIIEIDENYTPEQAKEMFDTMSKGAVQVPEGHEERVVRDVLEKKAVSVSYSKLSQDKKEQLDKHLRR